MIGQNPTICVMIPQAVPHTLVFWTIAVQPGQPNNGRPDHHDKTWEDSRMAPPLRIADRTALRIALYVAVATVYIEDAAAKSATETDDDKTDITPDLMELLNDARRVAAVALALAVETRKN